MFRGRLAEECRLKKNKFKVGRIYWRKCRLDNMPLTKRGEKIKSAMLKHYGKSKGERVFYASENKGNIKGVSQKEAMEIIKKRIKK